VHPRDFEIERRDGHPIHPRKGREIAPNTGIGVEPHPFGVGDVAERCDRVDNAVWEIGRRADHHHGLTITRFAHGGGIGRVAAVVLQRDPADFNVHQMRRLVEGGVCGLWQDDIGWA